MNSELMEYLSEKIMEDLRNRKNLSPHIYYEINKYPIIDFIRSKINVSDLELIIELMNSEDKNVLYFGISVTKNILDEELIKNKLLQLWISSEYDYKTRREVMWRILDIKRLPQSIHIDIYNFVKSNWDAWADDTLLFYGGSHMVLDAIKKRAQDPSFIEEKHWVYICLATLSTDISNAKAFITKYLTSDKSINALVAKEMLKKFN